MIAIITALSITLSPAQVGDIQKECTKYDGAEPTRCEVSLATKLFEYHETLQACAIRHQALLNENEELQKLLLEKPEPEDRWSLFGMPGWVTPVLAGVLVAGGVGVGLAL